jgi:N-acyl-D-amino-acid deacylase
VLSHLRSEDDDQIDRALDELIAQGKGSGARVHVAHIKVVYGHGAARAEQVLERLARARADGVRVTADIYPYNASYTTIGIVFPPWAAAGPGFKRAKQERRDELEAYLRERVKLRNGPEATLFGTGGFRGKTLAQLATDLGKPFEDVLIDDVGPSGAAAAFFVMDDALQTRLLVDPLVMIGSDGSPTSRHPRGYGTFARVIAEHVRKRKVLPIEQAIMKMTGLSARTLRLDQQRRGLVRPGWAADLVVFDPAAVEERATFDEPNRMAAGFDVVLVNGVLVREAGKRTSARPGLVLRPSKPAGGEPPRGG